ncbi:uncharacterized protein LOC116412838 [Galleria mellonella]|uniref:Uncharacterized protein LOC116412838 n=1 Tax=Galleria mellonella TaxID=7137 RepID=A0ABM3MA61_GALME|nr:uncharacterized protein LOC116412838 [Galleria mellonella]
MFSGLLITVLTIGRHANAHDIEVTTKKSEILVDKIRRKLMEDNYDYMSSETEELVSVKYTHNKPTNEPYYDHRYTASDDYNDVNMDKNQKLVARTNDKLESLTRYISPSEQNTGTDDQRVSKHDLLYYVDNEHLENDKNIENIITDSEAYEHMEIGSNRNDFSNTKVKYRMLKIKPQHQSRRSSSTYRRFIQEEGDKGVAIINLDDGPFPEFRLPRTRTQYMHQDESEDEMDAASLSDVSNISGSGDEVALT